MPATRLWFKDLHRLGCRPGLVCRVRPRFHKRLHRLLRVEERHPERLLFRRPRAAAVLHPEPEAVSRRGEAAAEAVEVPGQRRLGRRDTRRRAAATRTDI